LLRNVLAFNVFTFGSVEVKYEIDIDIVYLFGLVFKVMEFMDIKLIKYLDIFIDYSRIISSIFRMRSSLGFEIQKRLDAADLGWFELMEL